MLNIGVGATHVQNFLAALNVPCLHHKSIRALEDVMGKKVIEVAEKSCRDALDDEKAQSQTGMLYMYLYGLAFYMNLRVHLYI